MAAGEGEDGVRAGDRRQNQRRIAERALARRYTHVTGPSGIKHPKPHQAGDLEATAPSRSFFPHPALMCAGLSHTEMVDLLQRAEFDQVMGGEHHRTTCCTLRSGRTVHTRQQTRGE